MDMYSYTCFYSDYSHNYTSNQIFIRITVSQKQYNKYKKRAVLMPISYLDI